LSAGVAVIGTGTTGRLRAHLCRENPSVGYLALCDLDEAKLDTVAKECRADQVHTDARAAIDDPRVDAVIVATSEEAHFEPALAAIQRRKPVLVEKPITVSPAEGETLVAAAKDFDVPLRVGFTQRFRRRYMTAKEHLVAGFLGELSTVNAKIYATRAVADRVIERAPHSSPAVNTLTYCADLVLWYFGDRTPTRLYAQHTGSVLTSRHGVPDATWAIVTFDGGAVANLGVSWQPPRETPAYVASMELELFGPEGMLSITDNHRDALLVSSKPIPSPYSPNVTMHAALLGSAMPGDWALGRFYGPMRDETDLFLAGVRSGRMPAALPTGEHGLAVLNLTLAIDRSAASGTVLHLDQSRLATEPH
jgi:myo-inositol 2-dehydrogenase / D-chiro-inositol 1-dehydrogenase